MTIDNIDAAWYTERVPIGDCKMNITEARRALERVQARMDQIEDKENHTDKDSDLLDALGAVADALEELIGVMES